MLTEEEEQILDPHRANLIYIMSALTARLASPCEQHCYSGSTFILLGRSLPVSGNRHWHGVVQRELLVLTKPSEAAFMGTIHSSWRLVSCWWAEHRKSMGWDLESTAFVKVCYVGKHNHDFVFWKEAGYAQNDYYGTRSMLNRRWRIIHHHVVASKYLWWPLPPNFWSLSCHNGTSASGSSLNLFCKTSKNSWRYH